MPRCVWSASTSSAEPTGRLLHCPKMPLSSDFAPSDPERGAQAEPCHATTGSSPTNGPCWRDCPSSMLSSTFRRPMCRICATLSIVAVHPCSFHFGCKDRGAWVLPKVATRAANTLQCKFAVAHPCTRRTDAPRGGEQAGVRVRCTNMRASASCLPAWFRVSGKLPHATHPRHGWEDANMQDVSVRHGVPNCLPQQPFLVDIDPSLG